MLNIRGEKVFTQTELLENLSDYISERYPDTIHAERIDLIIGYVAAMIGNDEHYVQGYLKKALRLQR